MIGTDSDVKDPQKEREKRGRERKRNKSLKNMYAFQIKVDPV